MIRYRGVSSSTKYNRQGEPFTVYREEPRVPRIDDKFLDCAIYLYSTEDAANAGVSIGGSGFLVAVPGFGDGFWMLDGACPRKDFYHYYAVTNKHVIDAGYCTVRINRDENGATTDCCLVISIPQDHWHGAGHHDVAVAPIDCKKGYRYLFTPLDAFVTKQVMIENDIGIGDETFMVGRFISADGKQRNNPSVRWGHIAMMPTEISRGDVPWQEEESFVVESRSISGYSGSPVFVRGFPALKRYAEISPPIVDNRLVPDQPLFGMTPLVGGPWLLGVQWGYIYECEGINGAKYNTGMCGVVPAWYLRDVLNSEKLKMQRREEQEAIFRKQPRMGGIPT